MYDSEFAKLIVIDCSLHPLIDRTNHTCITVILLNIASIVSSRFLTAVGRSH